MSLEQMREMVKLIDGRAKVEASGNITEENIRAVAETGVDIISVGALTHSANALDISLDLKLLEKDPARVIFVLNTTGFRRIGWLIA